MMTLSAIEINALTDRLPAKLYYINSDGKDVPPDSVVIMVQSANGDSVGMMVVDITTSWVTANAIASDDITCWTVAPTMDDIDFGNGIGNYLVSYGAFNIADSATDWI